MAKIVRVKVGKEVDAPVKHMNEVAALRLAKADPEKYKILDEPTIEVLRLPNLDTQKKSVAAAGTENIGTDVPESAVKPTPAATTQTSDSVVKRGRPKLN